MSTSKIADIVAAIPFGNEGKKKYRTVGALLKQSDNDASKGPGFTIVLEAWFNPAGLPIGNGGEVFLSCYHPKERAKPAPEPGFRPRPPAAFEGDENDIPF